MPSFDVVSEIDQQEIRNAVDQAAREVSTRYDFKGTDSSIELTGNEIKLHSVSEDRLTALRQVLEEKLVKRKVSLKALDYQKVEEASGATARQLVKLVAGISKEKATELWAYKRKTDKKATEDWAASDEIQIGARFETDNLQDPGDDGTIRPLAGSDTRVVDLGGRAGRRRDDASSRAALGSAQLRRLARGRPPPRPRRAHRHRRRRVPRGAGAGPRHFPA